MDGDEAVLRGNFPSNVRALAGLALVPAGGVAGGQPLHQGLILRRRNL